MRTPENGNYVTKKAESDMTKEELVTWLSGKMRSEKNTTKEQLTAAAQLSQLKGWNEEKGNAQTINNFLQVMDRHVFGKTTGLPSARGIVEHDQTMPDYVQISE